MDRHTPPPSWNPLHNRRARKDARRPRPARTAFRPALERLETRLAPANVDVLSYHADVPPVTGYPGGRFLTGADLQETTLNPTNVNPTTFGRLAVTPADPTAPNYIDGYVYATPLYKADVPFPGVTHNVLYVATQHDSVYALDADNLSLLWKHSFINPAAGITTVPNGDVGSGDIVPEIGITGSPAIDDATGTLYVVAKTKEVRSDGNHWVQTLHALDITTGADTTTPYVIGDSKGDGFANQTSVIQVAGNGADSGGGMIAFNAFREHQRPSLTLLDGHVIVGWASHGDNGPYHGWVVSFDETTLQPDKWLNTNPNARGSGIWQSQGAISTDGTYLYFAIGNGFGANAFDPTQGNYSEAVLKVNPNFGGPGTAMTVADYFVPFNWRQLDNADADLGSGGVMLLPDSVGSADHPHLMVETGKDGNIYLLDRDHLGGNHDTFNDIVQQVGAGPAGVWGNPAFYQESDTSGLVYYHGSGADARSFRITGGMFTPAGIAYRSNQSFGFPGAQPVISADGQNNDTAIDWELQVDNYGQQGSSTLHAYLARPAGTTGTMTELFNSNGLGLRDRSGSSVKFTSATVSNGHVYAAQEYQVSLFGLFDPHTTAPGAPSDLALMPVTDTQIRLNWTYTTPGDATGIEVYRSAGDNMHYALVTTVPRDATTYLDPNLDPTQTYFYHIRAVNQAGASVFSNEVMGVTAIAAPILSFENVSSNTISLSWSRPQVANARYDVERSTDGGMTFTTIAMLPGTQNNFTDSPLTPGQYQYRIEAFTSGNTSALSNVVQTRIGPGSADIDYLNGFSASPFDLHANGSAQFAETTARLTNAINQAGSVFSINRENALDWTTQFTVRLHEGTQPNYADGFVFVLQNNSPSALGLGMGGLGYQGILNSVAIKFDTFDNEGENGSGGSTGLFFDGDRPTIPHQPGEENVPLDAAEVNLLSQSTKTITLSYDGTSLHETIVDADHPDTPFLHDYTVDVSAHLGSAISGNSNGYVGFTASTGDGGSWELQDVLGWRYTPVGPAAPHDLTATSAPTVGADFADLAWRSTSADEQGFRIYRATDPGGPYVPVGQVDAGVTSFHDTGLTPGTTYYYRVLAFNDDGDSGLSNTGFVCPGPHRTTNHAAGFNNTGDLHANGTATFPGQPVSGTPVGDFAGQQDIGTPGNPGTQGNATFAGDAYMLTASGSDIWDTADHFHYVYRPMTGDGEVVARVSMETNGDYWVKAGVMIRDNLSAGSPNAFMFETPHATPGGDHDEPVIQWRDAQDQGSADFGNHNGPIQQAPVWLRLVRSGQNFSGFWAQDNGDGTHGAWNLIGGIHTIPNMGVTVYVGLALTAHNNSQVAAATIDHVSLPPVAPASAQLSTGATGQAGSIFTTAKEPVGQPWSTSFTLQDIPVVGAADSLSFVIQNDPRGINALGGGGGAGGYSGIDHSIAVKFDLYTHNTHRSSTGLFTNGQSPDGFPGQDVDMMASGIDLASRHPFRVTFSYIGTTLSETVRDTVTGALFTHDYNINLTTTIGTDFAYVGFTGATGGESAFQDVLNWTADFCEPVVVHFGVSGYPSPAFSGDVNTFTVTALLPDNTPATGYTGTVHFTSTDPQAILPRDYTFTGLEPGAQHTFGAVLYTLGLQTITATDTATGQTGSQDVEVVPPPGPAPSGGSNFTPNPVTAATPGTSLLPAPGASALGTGGPAARADAAGVNSFPAAQADSAVTGYAGPTPSGRPEGRALLPADRVFGAGDGGPDSFSAVLNTPGGPWVDALDVLMANLRTGGGQ
jgi:hypothetical protein